MSQCHRCDKPCGHVLTFQIPSTYDYCVIGPILNALPTLSPEALAVMTAVAEGAFYETVRSSSGVKHWMVYEPSTKPDPCPKCGGSGEVFPPPDPVTFHKGPKIPCSTCGGSGEVYPECAMKAPSGSIEPNPCPKCGGSGTLAYGQTGINQMCPLCHGTGIAILSNVVK